MAAESGVLQVGADPWRNTLLNDLLGSIRVRSSHFFRMALSAPWGISVDLDAARAALLHFGRVEREQVANVQGSAFHIVAAGSCWLQMVGAPSRIRLEAGDFVVIPRADLHVISDEPTSHAVGLLDLLKANRPGPNGELNAGGAGSVSTLVCGGMAFDNVNINPLFAALPPLIQVKGSEDGGAPWLRLTVQHVIDELDANRPGVDAVVGRLADILFIGAVRSYVEESLARAESGWLAAVRDKQVGRAIALLHAEPSRPWTVEMLADRVALSRSAFASRFTQLVGEPPLRYLTRVRMDAAARRLRATSDKLVRVSTAAGYDSVAAFTRAFERHLGLTPGEYRRTRHGP